LPPTPPPWVGCRREAVVFGVADDMKDGYDIATSADEGMT
jgi:hypothetical protein